jgi:hypothetical protein
MIVTVNAAEVADEETRMTPLTRQVSRPVPAR